MRQKFKISKAVIEKDGKYLLLKRATSSYPDTWDFTGGINDKNETSTEAVIRETKEETALDIEPGEEIKKAFYVDDNFELTFHYFIPESISGTLKLSNDHSEYIWKTKEELKELDLHPSVSKFFESEVESL